MCTFYDYRMIKSRVEHNPKGPCFQISRHILFYLIAQKRHEHESTLGVTQKRNNA